MDKLQWFKFSYADWRMGKIQRCPEVTQARFINLCCLYWSKEANLSYDDAEIEIDKEHLDILLAKKIIEINDEHIFIKFLDEQLEDITETSKGKSKAAKIRWNKHRERKALEEQTNTDAMHVHTDVMQNNAEKRREEKIREEKRRKDKKQKTATPKNFSFFNYLVDYGFNKDLVNDWLKVRKTKKATNTETALNSFFAEVEKSKLSKDEILKICIERDWKGFKAEWLKNVETKQDIKSEYSFLDQYKKK